MNLWAKSIRQLAMLPVALFFFSCEDENSIIGFKNPSDKFNVYYQEIPLTTSVLPIDKIVTDNKLVQSGISLVGSYTDPIMGQVKAESYLQLYPTLLSALPASADVDSVVLQVRLNYYTYGLTENRTESFTIHEISGDSLDRRPDQFYYSTSSATYVPDVLGTASVSLNLEDVKKEAGRSSNQQDTLLMRVRLSEFFEEHLMSRAKLIKFDKHPTGVRDTFRTSMKNFIMDIKGLALVPTAESNTIMGLNIYSSYSGVTMYYHTSSDTTSTVFLFNHASFTGITVDRNGTDLAGAQPYVEMDPASGNRYIQNGAGIVTAVDLSNFYAFADTVENIIINSAELVVGNVESPEGYNPHSSLRFRFMSDSKTFGQSDIDADSVLFSKYHHFSDGIYFSAQGDNPSQQDPYSGIAYDAANKRLSGYMTLFAQSLFRHKNDDQRLRYFALFPNTPFINRSVNRTVFHKDNIKLRISYTRPTSNVTN